MRKKRKHNNNNKMIYIKINPFLDLNDLFDGDKIS